MAADAEADGGVPAWNVDLRDERLLSGPEHLVVSAGARHRVLPGLATAVEQGRLSELEWGQQPGLGEAHSRVFLCELFKVNQEVIFKSDQIVKRLCLD